MHNLSEGEGIENRNGSLRTSTKDAHVLQSVLFLLSSLPPYLNNVLSCTLVHPLKTRGGIGGNSWLDDLSWENAIGHSYLRVWEQKPGLCAFHFPCLSLTESPITKHQDTFPVAIVTLSSHHRP